MISMKTPALSLVGLVALAFVSGGGARTHGASNPPWLKTAERSTLSHVFGGAKPIKTSYVNYPNKIAVVWKFDHAVTCRLCSAPQGSAVGGRIIRISFDRSTHRWTGALRACSTMQVCLRR